MSDRPIRVLHIVRIMRRAGVETWLMHLLRHFDRREIAIDLLVYSDEPGDYDEEIRALGGRIFRCPHPRRPWRYARQLLRILRSEGPWDAVHSHNYFFSGVDMRVAARAGVPQRIAHLHPVRDIEAGRPLRWIYQRWMGRWIARYSNMVLAPSQASLDAFEPYADLSDRPRFVVRNCVDTSAIRPGSAATPADRIRTRRELGLPSDCPVILYVARFVPHKNHGLMAELAEELGRRGIRAHFVAAGTDGEARAAFEQRIAGRGDFSVLANHADIAPLLRAADVFFFPSTEEGFGVVAIEAAAAGLPVVASNLPGIREACCPGHRAFLFEPKGAATAAGHIERILSDPALYRSLSEEGVAWASRFSIEAAASHLRAIYGGNGARPVARDVGLPVGQTQGGHAGI